MDLFAKRRLIAWMFILLVVINIGSLATVWFLHFQGPPPFRPPREGIQENVKRFLEKEMNLTSKQSQQFIAIRGRYFKQSLALMDEIHRLRFELLSKSFDPLSDTLKVKSIAQMIGEKQEKLELLTYSQIKDLYSVCRPDQQKIFKELLRKILVINGPPEPPGERGNMPPPRGIPPWRQ